MVGPEYYRLFISGKNGEDGGFWIFTTSSARISDGHHSRSKWNKGNQ